MITWLIRLRLKYLRVQMNRAKRDNRWAKSEGRRIETYMRLERHAEKHAWWVHILDEHLDRRKKK